MIRPDHAADENRQNENGSWSHAERFHYHYRSNKQVTQVPIQFKFFLLQLAM